MQVTVLSRRLFHVMTNSVVRQQLLDDTVSLRRLLGVFGCFVWLASSKFGQTVNFYSQQASIFLLTLQTQLKLILGLELWRNTSTRWGQDPIPIWNASTCASITFGPRMCSKNTWRATAHNRWMLHNFASVNRPAQSQNTFQSAALFHQQMIQMTNQLDLVSKWSLFDMIWTSNRGHIWLLWSVKKEIR